MKRALALLVGPLLLAACGGEPAAPDREAVVQEDLAAIRAAVEAYAADHGGELPPTLDVLVRPDGEGRHYLPSGTPALFDPWGRRYSYEPAGDGTFEVRVAGGP